MGDVIKNKTNESKTILGTKHWENLQSLLYTKGYVFVDKYNYLKISM